MCIRKILEVRILSVAGEGVLCQVVRSDGEEINLLRELL